jgi:hypothetical protein
MIFFYSFTFEVETDFKKEIEANKGNLNKSPSQAQG